MSDDADLTLLLETLDPVELAGARSLLDAHEVNYVVQGELHASMLGGMMGNPAIVPRVLVSKRDLEQARALLTASPEAETQPQAGLEGAECPVHLKPATAACDRCGTFLCGDCKALGAPPLCEDCSVSEDWQRKPKDARANRMKKAVAWMLLAPALFALAMALLALLNSFLR
jgi:hypothetical protein